MAKAFEVLFPVFVTMLLGYGAARHGRFGPDEVPNLNKVVLLYAIPMSIAASLLRISRSTLLGHLGLVLALAVALVGTYVLSWSIMRVIAHVDISTSALRAMAIAFPAVPLVGPSLLVPLFGPISAILIAGGSLVGNLVLVPLTLVCLSIGDQRTKQTGEQPTTPTGGQPVPAGGTVTVATKEANARTTAAAPQSAWLTFRQAVVDGVSQPIVWLPLIALVVVLLDVPISSTVDNALNLLGQSAGGVGLFTTGIILQSQSVQLSGAVIGNVVGKNLVTPVIALGAAYLLGQGNLAWEVAVTASIFSAPLIVSLAIEHDIAERETSSSLLLSAALSVLTTGIFITLATR